MAEERWVVFGLGALQHAAPIDRVREILRPVPVTRMPRVAPFVRGLFNLRGQVLPLLDTKARLGLADATASGPAKARVVVVETAAGGFGLMVDEVFEVLRCGPEVRQTPEAVMELSAARFTESVLDLGGRLIFVLDLDALVEGVSDPGSVLGFA
ncbi:MAG: chemotaxis protein CheW [bacterium]